MWYHYPIWFVAGAFLVNAVPHFVQGVSGHRFQSPFASPPGVGESSPVINVLWGSANAAVGYLLVYGVGDFGWGLSADALCLFAGGALTALGLASHFGRVRGATSA